VLVNGGCHGLPFFAGSFLLALYQARDGGLEDALSNERWPHELGDHFVSRLLLDILDPLAELVLAELVLFKDAELWASLKVVTYCEELSHVPYSFRGDSIVEAAFGSDGEPE
jgi:hypothetical protein